MFDYVNTRFPTSSVRDAIEFVSYQTLKMDAGGGAFT